MFSLVDHAAEERGKEMIIIIIVEFVIETEAKRGALGSQVLVVARSIGWSILACRYGRLSVWSVGLVIGLSVWSVS